jgi:hypothetical protein
LFTAGFVESNRESGRSDPDEVEIFFDDQNITRAGMLSSLSDKMLNAEPWMLRIAFEYGCLVLSQLGGLLDNPEFA